MHTNGQTKTQSTFDLDASWAIARTHGSALSPRSKRTSVSHPSRSQVYPCWLAWANARTHAPGPMPVHPLLTNSPYTLKQKLEPRTMKSCIHGTRFWHDLQAHNFTRHTAMGMLYLATPSLIYVSSIIFEIRTGLRASSHGNPLLLDTS